MMISYMQDCEVRHGDERHLVTGPSEGEMDKGSEEKGQL